MRLGDYNIEGRAGTMIIGKILLDEDYNIGEWDQPANEFIGSNIMLPIYDFGYDDYRKNEIKEFMDTLKEKKRDRMITLIIDRDGDPHVMDIHAKYREGEDLCYELKLWELSNLETDMEFFRENMWKYRVMLYMTNQIFFDYNLDSGIISIYRYVSKKSVRIFYDSFDAFEVGVKECAEKTEKNLYAIEQMIAQIRENKNSVEATIRTGLLHMDKKIQKLHFRVRYDDMYGHRMMYGVINNMSETEDDVPYYLTAAGLDSATGLLSKRSLIEYSEDILTNPATASRKHYMVLLDIDDFKSINDNLGHQMGDKAINLLASSLADVVQDFGIIGRYGGDEFYILTDKIENEEDLRTMLRNIRGTAQYRAKEQLGIEKLTLSLGVSSYPENGKNYNDLLSLCDKALYIAKEKGKNRYVIYRPEMHENIQTGSDRKGISSYDEQAKAINKVVKALFIEGSAAIEESFPIITKGFDMDSIDIFYGEDLKRYKEFGKYPSGLDVNVFVGNQKYMDQFDENGVFVLNNYNNYKNAMPQLFDYLSDKKCMSMIQVAMPNPDKPEYFISFNMMNRIHKWSDAEISSLGLYGTLIYESLTKGNN